MRSPMCVGARATELGIRKAEGSEVAILAARANTHIWGDVA